MNINKKILIIVGIVVGVVLMTGGTVLLLRNVVRNEPAADTTSQNEATLEELSHEKANGINHEANQKAKAIQKEADMLIETDPVKAQEKYIEAEKAYVDAGNGQKAAEMRDNATTAEASQPPAPPDDLPPLASGGTNS